MRRVILDFNLMWGQHNGSNRTLVDLYRSITTGVLFELSHWYRHQCIGVCLHSYVRHYTCISVIVTSSDFYPLCFCSFCRGIVHFNGEAFSIKPLMLPNKPQVSSNYISKHPHCDHFYGFVQLEFVSIVYEGQPCGKQLLLFFVWIFL